MTHLPDGNSKAFPTGHAVLYFMIFSPLSGQTLWLLNLWTQTAGMQFISRWHLSFIKKGPNKAFVAHLQWLVLPAELLHGCCCVVQLPPELHHFGLQFLDLTFSLHTPETQPCSGYSQLWRMQIGVSSGYIIYGDQNSVFICSASHRKNKKRTLICSLSLMLIRKDWGIFLQCHC